MGRTYPREPEHLDLVRYSACELDKMGFNLMALGSPVEIMEAYEFSLLVQMIVATKSIVPTKPMHLFGAGHPLTIPLVVALGCDMFDSASYMLYAKDNRYMHANGTARLEDLKYLRVTARFVPGTTRQRNYSYKIKKEESQK